MHSLNLAIIRNSLGQVGFTIIVIVLASAVIEMVLYAVLKVILKNKYAIPIMLLAPAAVGLIMLVVYPVFYEFKIAFSNMSLRHFKNPSYGLARGWNNLKLIFTQPVLKQVMFFPLLLRTILWTVIQLSFHVSLGLGLAILLNRKMKLRGLYRTILIIPWAIPQVIAALTWRGEFQYQYGFINIMLRDIGLTAIQWKSDPFWNFVAMNITNIWLGVPFMMIILLGGLQSISAEYYEAAEIDGASAWDRFKSITLPMLSPVMAPAVILGTIWTFNNFNIPFFINENELETSDILVTALFRAAFQYNRYGFAAAFAFVIFLVLFIFAVLYMRATGGLKGVYEK